MSWTEIARRGHDRRGLRCASDCTDREWAIIAPLLVRTTKVGRLRLHRARDLWNAIQYLAATGCQWVQLPRDFPPFTMVQYHFYRMRDSGLLDGSTRCWSPVRGPRRAARPNRPRVVIAQHRSLIHQRDEIEQLTNARLADHVDYQLLLNIPSIGPINALTLANLVCNIDRLVFHERRPTIG